MNRRRFLQALGLAPVAAKTYVFFGGIFRPAPITATSILESWKEIDEKLADNRAVAQWLQEYAKLIRQQLHTVYGYPSGKWFTLKLKEQAHEQA
jgi:hypothetical protein